MSAGRAGAAAVGRRGPASLWERRSPSAQSNWCAWTERPAALQTNKHTNKQTKEEETSKEQKHSKETRCQDKEGRKPHATHQPNKGKETHTQTDVSVSAAPPTPLLLLRDNPDNRHRARRKIKRGVVMVTVESISAKGAINGVDLYIYKAEKQNSLSHPPPGREA